MLNIFLNLKFRSPSLLLISLYYICEFISCLHMGGPLTSCGTRCNQLLKSKISMTVFGFLLIYCNGEFICCLHMGGPLTSCGTRCNQLFKSLKSRSSYFLSLVRFQNHDKCLEYLCDCFIVSIYTSCFLIVYSYCLYCQFTFHTICFLFTL